MKKFTTSQVVQTALFIALAIVVRQFSFMIPFGGTNGMRIGVSEVFTKMPALLFGPVLGGIASGLVDWLSQLIKAEGAYLLPILFVMILGGFLTGAIWKAIKKTETKKLRIAFFVVCLFLAVFGAVNQVILAFNIKGAFPNLLSSLGDKSSFATYGMYFASGLGFIFLLADFLIKKKSADYSEDFFPLVITVFSSDFVVTTLNTFVLRYFYSGLAKIPFLTYYLPRVLQDVISAMVFAYILSALLKIYQKVIKR